MLRRICAAGARPNHVVLLHRRNLECAPLFISSAKLLCSSAPKNVNFSTNRCSASNRPEEIEVNIETDLDHPQWVSSKKSSLSDDKEEEASAFQLPQPTNAPHSDLTTFLAYAARTRLSRTSTTYRGTHYEYVTAETLRQYGFELVRVGGRGDDGVDLVGTWTLPRTTTTGKPSLPTTGEPGFNAVEKQKEEEKGTTVPDSNEAYPMNHTTTGTRTSTAATTTAITTIGVLVQCKRFTGKGKLGPSLVRELQGAMRSASVPVGWRGPGVLGILVGPRPATRGVRDALANTRRPMAWLLLDPPSDEVDQEVNQEQEKEKEEEAVESKAGEEEADREDDKAGTNETDPASPLSTLPHSPPQQQTKKGRICQMLWNRAAADLGLEGLSVVARHDTGSRSKKITDSNPAAGAALEKEKPKEKGKDKKREKEVTLLWRGEEIVFPHPSTPASATTSSR